MPNTPEHPVLDLEAFALKQERAERKALIDYAFWGAATPKNIEQFVPLHKQGCVGFKAFTVYAGSNYPFSDEYSQLKEMEKVASFHGIFGAHAEDRTLVNGFSNEHKEEPWSLAVHDASRPWIAELTAINTLLLYAEKTGCKLHICHMSIPEGAERIASARRMGVDVTVETCAHYLTLNYQDQAYLGTFAMINPPLRSRDRMERLWKYVLDGTIDYLGTDHAPYLLSDKLPPDGDLRKAACGAPEIDVAIPLILEEGVRNRKMPLQHLHQQMQQKDLGCILEKVFWLWGPMRTFIWLIWTRIGPIPARTAFLPVSSINSRTRAGLFTAESSPHGFGAMRFIAMVLSSRSPAMVG